MLPPTWPSAWSSYGLFLKQFVRHFRTTGAVMPSGRPLAAALCRYVGQGPSPQRILEVGPGTGAVTRMLVERMRNEDELRLVEVNETFVTYLRTALKEQARSVSRARVDVVHGRVEDLPDDEHYDVIISGLPLNNFTAPEVERILQGFARLLKADGVLSFFQYIAVRSARAYVSSPRERERLRAIDMVLTRTLAASELQRDWVWPNLPPAWVHHVRF